MTTALATTPRQTSADIAANASAALAKATIEAKFTMAMHRPRNFMEARGSILDSCKRPAFAARAMYAKPQGGQTITGLNIRFAEMALQCWRNIDVTATTVWEDDERRVVRIVVTDLESNSSYSDEASLAKTVERSSVKKGQEVIGERLNSKGEITYIIRATEDELTNKVNSAKSKVIRNSVLRLIPQDILEESLAAIKVTNSGGGEDPKKASKSVCDAFAGIGVNPTEIEMYLGHALTTVSPSELADLRAIYSTIRDGEASWSDYTRKEADATVVPAEVVTPAAPKAETATPQQNLAQKIEAAGFSFTDFQAWAVKTQPEMQADSLDRWDMIQPEVARRLYRGVSGIIAVLKEGGAN